MRTFTAGRFTAECFTGVQNGRCTYLVESHANGSGDEMGKLRVQFDDLPDLLHVLTRAIKAQEESA